MKRSWLIGMLLCAAMVCSAAISEIWAAEGDVSYYYDSDGTPVDVPPEKVMIVGGKTISWNSTDGKEWFVVSEDITLNERVEVSGDVKLLLCDGATLTASKGIHVTGTHSLTIYGQEKSDGKLLINECNEYQAAIGGNNRESGGRITINGSTLEVYGGKNAAGIGGGPDSTGTGGQIVINNGNIYVKGGEGAAGIGGGQYAPGTTQEEKIIINGGSVEATSKNYGAGIGGGRNSPGGNIEINGGKVTAKGDQGSAGIGSGFGSYVEKQSGGCIKITGGVIYAKGSAFGDIGSAGIGGGHKGPGGSIMISGGTIHATGGLGKVPGDGIGNGGGYDVKSDVPSIFSTGDNGTAIVFAKAGGEGAQAISDKSGKDNWHGIIFEGDDGFVYGEQTLREDLTIADGQTLTIPKAAKLTVPSDVALNNQGTIDGEGTLLGRVTGNQPKETVDDGMVEISAEINPDKSGMVSGDGKIVTGNLVMLEAKPSEGYHFVEWQKDGETASNKNSYTFTAEKDCSLTAVFEPHIFTEEWKYNDTAHWQECTCSVRTKERVHDGGTASCSVRAKCTTCEQSYGKIAAHTLTAHDAVPATCTESGSAMYWQCNNCEKRFADDEGGKELMEVITPATGHTLTHRPRVAPTYSTTGVAEHYACNVCDALFLDAQAKHATHEEALVLPVLERPSEPPVVVPSLPKVEIVEAAHGSVSLSPQRPSRGARVTLTVHPDEGYEVDTVAVIDREGKHVAVEKQDDSSYCYVQPRRDVRIVVTFAKCDEASVILAFHDVNETAWYHDAVAEVYAQGLMTGTAREQFAPEMPVTRAVAVSILHRMAGSPAADDVPFHDVALEDWYGQAVAWAAVQGITGGTGDGKFSPQRVLTREQLAALLYRHTATGGQDTRARVTLEDFADAATISPWAREAVQWACAEGLLAGIDTTILSPQGETTRAQMAAILVRYMALLDEEN